MGYIKTRPSFFLSFKLKIIYFKDACVKQFATNTNFFQCLCSWKNIQIWLRSSGSKNLNNKNKCFLWLFLLWNVMKRYETLVGLYQVKVFCNVATFFFCLYHQRKNFMFMFTSFKKIKIVDCIIIDNTIMKKKSKRDTNNWRFL